MKELFDEAEIEVTEDNKKEIDEKIHGIVEVDYKNCSETWKAIKERMEKDREGFLKELKMLHL
jgi:ATP-dependent Zn protease